MGNAEESRRFCLRIDVSFIAGLRVKSYRATGIIAMLDGFNLCLP